MAVTGAGDGGLLFRGVFEGSISGSHTEVERRPYHKNCSCALHGSRRGRGAPSIVCNHHKANKVSYPIRRSWSEGTSLALFAAPSSSSSVSPSPSSSTAIDQVVRTGNNTLTLPRHQHGYRRCHSQLHLDVFDEEHGDDLFPTTTKM